MKARKKFQGQVILVRGIPGSGKSHYAEELQEKFKTKGISGIHYVYCSADQFFMVRSQRPVVEGKRYPSLEYQYDPTKLGQAHAQCQRRFIDALHTDAAVIIVDNTFIRLWELENYIRLARDAGYEVTIFEMQVETIKELKACVARNVHKVPAEVIARMAMDFEPYINEGKDGLVRVGKIVPYPGPGSVM